MRDEVRRIVPELAVSDLERSVRWYVEGLGLRLDWRLDGYAVLSLDGQLLFLRESAKPGGGATVVVGREDFADVDRIWARCRELGIAVADPLATRSWELREFTVRDPDGHRIRFVQKARGLTHDVEPIPVRRVDFGARIERRLAGVLEEVADRSGRTVGEIVERLLRAGLEPTPVHGLSPDLAQCAREVLEEARIGYSLDDMSRFVERPES